MLQSHALLLVPLVAAGLLAVPARPRSSSGVVVSQVYAGGGNSGASFTNDFVELFNAGSTAIDLDGWTIQYASAAGTTWQVTALAGSIAPGRHYLVQLASAGVGRRAFCPPPTPPGRPTSPSRAARSRSSRDTTPLDLRGLAGSCSAVTRVADLSGTAPPPTTRAAAPRRRSTTRPPRFARATGARIPTPTRPTSLRTRRRRATRRRRSDAAAADRRPTGASQSAARRRRHPARPLARARAARVSFGTRLSGTTPAPVSERVTVISNNASGYSLPSIARLSRRPTSRSASRARLRAVARSARLSPAAPWPRPDPAGGRPAGRNDVRPQRSAGDVWHTRLGFARRSPWSPPGATRRPSPSRYRPVRRGTPRCWPSLVPRPLCGGGPPRPPVALTATPSRVALDGAGRRSAVTNRGRARRRRRGARGILARPPRAAAVVSRRSPVRSGSPSARRGFACRRERRGRSPSRRGSRRVPSPATTTRSSFLTTRRRQRGASPCGSASGSWSSSGRRADRPAPGRPSPPCGSPDAWRAHPGALTSSTVATSRRGSATVACGLRCGAGERPRCSEPSLESSGRAAPAWCSSFTTVASKAGSLRPRRSPLRRASHPSVARFARSSEKAQSWRGSSHTVGEPGSSGHARTCL